MTRTFITISKLAWEFAEKHKAKIPSGRMKKIVRIMVAKMITERQIHRAGKNKLN